MCFNVIDNDWQCFAPHMASTQMMQFLKAWRRVHCSHTRSYIRVQRCRQCGNVDQHYTSVPLSINWRSNCLKSERMTGFYLNTSTAIGFGCACVCVFVGSLYVRSSIAVSRKPVHRDAPSEVRRRMRAVAVASGICVTSLYALSRRESVSMPAFTFCVWFVF